MRAHYIDTFKPYAGWAALVLLVIGLFVGLIAANVFLPLMLLAGAIAAAAFRYWEDLKRFDFWALDEWIRTRRDSMSVRHWHAPHHAAEYFCNPSVVAARNEAAAEMNNIMMDLIRKPDRDYHPRAAVGVGRTGQPGSGDADHARYDAAQVRYNQSSAALARELHDQLTRGDLVAKGLLMRDEIALSERVIPTSRWRVMALDIAKGSATGSGWHYTGVLVGKRAVTSSGSPKPNRPPDAGNRTPAQPAKPVKV